MRALALGLLAVLVGLGGLGIGLAETYGAAADSAGSTVVAAQQLLYALSEQHAGLWGYAASRQPTMLDDYREGQGLASQATAQLVADTAGTAEAPRVARVSSDIRRWQSWAESMVRRAAAGGAEGSPADASEGSRLFTRFQVDAGALQQSLLTLRNQRADAARDAAYVSLGVMVGGSLVVSVLLVMLVRRMVRSGLHPMLTLADTARRVALGERMSIPFEDGEDEIAELAGGLRAWHDAAAERAILSEQAPVGICRLDLDGRVTSVNPALAAMFGHPEGIILGRPLRELIHPDDRASVMAAVARVPDGQRLSVEARGLRADGSLIWCSVKVGPLLAPDGRAKGAVVMIEDVTARKQQSERAARIQRDLWPQIVPELEGYDLAGACRPALDVAGDFYDWSVTPDGDLDLTVADVMGKGIGAALVMATLRASLRSAPVELGPAERLRLAAESAPLGGDEEGLFVTVFQARLRPATGELRYVDAGHGYCAIRRANGDLAPLSEHSLPVWVEADEEFRQGRVVLQPGEMLVVYSDGLVELGEQPTSLQAYSADLDRAADATDAVSSLLGRMPAQLPDDVTVLVLRRLAPLPASDELVLSAGRA
jgi:PAS domain S-box-containing protein